MPTDETTPTGRGRELAVSPRQIGEALPDQMPTPMEPQTAAFLLKDYELKIRYLSDHYSRMWSRANFFVSLETALSVALFGWFKDKGDFAGGAAPIAIVGAISSLCWYVFGAQDRYLAEVYRQQVRIVGEELGTQVPESIKQKSYSYVGDTIIKDTLVPKRLYQWRSELFSTTKLVAWFPLLVSVYWLLMVALIMS